MCECADVPMCVCALGRRRQGGVDRTEGQEGGGRVRRKRSDNK